MEIKLSTVLNYVFLTIIVVLLNVMMNMQKPEKVIQTPTEKPKPEVLVKEVEVETTPLIHLTNNEKAALFLLIPLVGFAVSMGAGIKKAKKTKLHKDKVVFN